MSKVIGVNMNERIEWHAVNSVAGVDYHTFCGVDAYDPALGHFGTVTAPPGQKIDCQRCFNLWRGVTSMRLRDTSFSDRIK